MDTSPNNITPLVYTPRTVAKLLGVSVDTLADWRVRGEGPVFIKMGGRLVAYCPADVTAWVNSRPTYKHTSDPGTLREII